MRIADEDLTSDPTQNLEDIFDRRHLRIFNAPSFENISIT